MQTMTRGETKSPKVPTSETRLKAVPVKTTQEPSATSFVDALDALDDLKEDLMIACDAAGHGAEECDVCERLKGGLCRLSMRLDEIREDIDQARSRRATFDPVTFGVFSRLIDAGVEPGTIPGLEGALELFARLMPVERRKSWSPEAIMRAIRADGSDAPTGTWAHRLDLAEQEVRELAERDHRAVPPAGARRRGRTVAAAAEGAVNDG